MDVVRLAVLGAGSVRCAPAVIGALASYFGERPLEVRFWDSDAERLDLFDQFARLLFTMNKAKHRLISTEDEAEAQEGVDRAILALDENAARRYLRRFHPHGIAELGAEAMIEQALETLLTSSTREADVLSLLPGEIDVPLVLYRHLDWPPEPSEWERTVVPHQVLRYLREDEYPFEFLREHAKSPIRRWLEDPTSVELAARG